MKNKFFAGFALVVIFLSAVILPGALNKKPEQYAEPIDVEYIDVSVSSFSVMSGSPYVRSTSERIGDREDSGNAYGRFSEDNGLALPSVVRVRLSGADRLNGPYVGIYVADLSAEELSAFPKRVLKELEDKPEVDGIVWISTQYVTWATA